MCALEGRLMRYSRHSGLLEKGSVLSVLVALAASTLLIAAPAEGQSYGTPMNVYMFKGYNNGDGAGPVAGLTMASGVIYGVTSYGGSAGYGTIFEVDPNPPQGTPVEMLLHNFGGGSDGAAPVSRLVFGQDNNLYGTTASGETDDCLGVGGCGTVFTLTRLEPPCDPYCDWAFTPIYSFDQAHGADPYGELAFDANNNIYGTTRYGGNGGGIISGTSPQQATCMANNSSAATYGCGTVYEIGYTGGRHPSWNIPPSLLWQFDSSQYTPTCGLGSFGYDGIQPLGGVVFDNGGNVLGSTLIGGQSGTSHFGYGTVFQLTSGSRWTEQLLKNLDGGTPGGYSFTTFSSQGPQTAPFYGSTADGGGSVDDGTVFDLISGGSCGSWQFNRLQPVGEGSGTDLDVQGPRGDLVLVTYPGNPNLYLYGTQTTGGTYNKGAVFQMVNSNGSWSAPTTIYNFMGGSDGAFPVGGLVADSSGNLYGITYSGGNSPCVLNVNGNGVNNTNNLGCGVVFELVNQ